MFAPTAARSGSATRRSRAPNEAAAKAAGLPLDKVVVHNHLIGGGFGRRLESDGVERAVEIAKQVDGPVKVVWTREEDIQHDMYRPMFFDRLSAGLDAKGTPAAWNNRFAGPSIIARWLPAGFNNGLDPDTTEGAIDLVYDLPNLHVEYVRVEPPAIPTAFWRSVGPSHNVFVTESFMDELAAAAKQDPVAYRLALLDKTPRAKAVLALAADKSGWGQKLPPRVGRGVSIQNAFAKLHGAGCRGRSGEGRHRPCPARRLRGRLRHRGQSRHRPRADPERGHVRHHRGALWRDHAEERPCGAVQLRQLPDLRMNEAPDVEVHIVQSLESPGGMGEAGTSAIVPAVTNAIFAATGKRLRMLPVDISALKQPA